MPRCAGSNGGGDTVARLMAYRILGLMIVIALSTGCVKSLAIPPELLTALFNASQTQARAQQTVQAIGELMACVSAQNAAPSAADARCGRVVPAVRTGNPPSINPSVFPSLMGSASLTLTPNEIDSLTRIFTDALDQWRQDNASAHKSLRAAQADLITLSASSRDATARAFAAQDIAKASYANASAQWNAWITNLILLVDTQRDVSDWRDYTTTAVQATKASDNFFTDAASAWSSARTALSDQNEVAAKRALVVFLRDRVATSQKNIDALEAGLATLKSLAPAKALVGAGAPVPVDTKGTGNLSAAANASQTPPAMPSGDFGQAVASAIPQLPGISQIPVLGTLLQAWLQDFEKQAQNDRDRMKKELQSREWQPWGCITGEKKGAECGLATEPASPPPPQPMPTPTPPSPTPTT